MIVNKRIGLMVLMRESIGTLLVLAAWDFVVVILYQLFHQEWMEIPSLPLSLIGSALALFMSVRNNTAYARWWEGRTLWGAITNNSRSFGRQVCSILGGRKDLVRAMAAYPHALRTALGQVDATKDVERLLAPEMAARIKGWKNQPNGILVQLGMGVTEEATKLGIDGALHGQIDRILSDLANAQGGLERIQKTPLPIQYSGLPRALANIFCVVLPLSAVQTLGWITPLGSSLVGLLFVVLDKTGADLQEPFINTPHALPMAAMATTIETDLLQSIGEAPPSPIAINNGVQP
ncbi:bestrophin family protein [Acetobacter aceti]|uniref:Membrane protein n=1 Tax=Acetobacter aceti TaxID=435 RepID=A0A6S6PKA6_ACEAC|nr:bestrophin family ion channel [Acetobacter aceti]BCI67256.1 membrane protein [Acetobacter aceti]